MLRRCVLSLFALATVVGEASAQPAVGSEFRVNTFTTDDQREPAIASDANGSFVVVWNSIFQDGDYFGVFGQRYDRRGKRRGASSRSIRTLPGPRLSRASRCTRQATSW